MDGLHLLFLLALLYRHPLLKLLVVATPDALVYLLCSCGLLFLSEIQIYHWK